jgi:hypothetical protein
MAVGTQQSKIALVHRPVGESSAPTVLPLLWLVLTLGVDVVNVENSHVVNSAFAAASAKLGNQGQFAFPDLSPLVNFVSVSIPKALAALFATEPQLARLFAAVAFAAAPPSGREVAVLSTVFSGAITQPVGVHGSRFAAMQTAYRSGLCSHSAIIAVADCPMYFELSRNALFEPPPQIIQQRLDLTPA